MVRESSPARAPRKPPASQRTFVAGPTGSGKSALLMHWARAYPRQLVLDVTGEWASPSLFAGTVIYASNRPELLAALQQVAELERWRVVVATERITPEELTNLLVPVHREGRTSYTRAVGGLCLVIDEAAEMASHGQSHKIRPLWLRGRHHGLSILAGSQRAADVGRMVTSQSERVAVLRTDEPLDLAYWRSAIRPEYYQALLGLGQFQAVVVNRVRKVAGVYTTHGEMVRPIVAGEVLEP